jgi:hypothetical protein
MSKSITGHYIWNRAERVDEKLMPHVVTESFDHWERELRIHLNDFSKQRQDQLMYRINKERNKMNNSLVNLGYKPHYK